MMLKKMSQILSSKKSDTQITGASLQREVKVGNYRFVKRSLTASADQTKQNNNNNNCT